MKAAGTLLICTCLLWFSTIASALNPDRDIHQVAHRSWGEKEGYPGRAQALAQTTDGFLWIGSDVGLFRFDGIHFERYVPESGDKLSEGPVRNLLALADGSLWIAYRYGNSICVLRNGNVKSYGNADGVTSHPTIIVQDHQGIIWANTETGVIRFNGSRWEHIGKNWNFPEDVPHLTSYMLFVDSRGTLWAGVNNTILYLKQKAKRFEPTGAFAGFSQSIAEARDGTIWFSDERGYVRAIRTPVSAKSAAIAKCEVETPAGKPIKCPGEGPLVIKTRLANDLLFDRDGSLWIATGSSGLIRVPHPEWLKSGPISETREAIEGFDAKDGLSADNCNPLLEDREGDIWVATRDGLDQFRDTALVPVTLPTSMIHNAIAAADGGDIWVAGSWSYVARVNAHSTNVSLLAGDAFKPYRDPAGVTWLMGNSLGQWKKGRFQKVAPSPDGIDGGYREWQVAGDRFGTLWGFSNGHGFFSLEHLRWKRWATPLEVAKQRVANMFSDSTGRIWVSTYEGDIISMDRGNIVDYPGKLDNPLDYVKAFAERAPEQIWAGGSGGLVLIDRGQVRRIKPAAVASVEDVTGIVDAGSKGLWLNTANGVIHLSRDEEDRALRDPSYRFQWERFDSADGLPGRTQAIDPYPEAIQGTDGRIWFTATRGVAWIDPNKDISRNADPPPVSITSVLADGSPHLRSADLRLPAHTANVQISYTALSLSVPERVRFKYKLDGIDPGWRDPGTRREAYYSRLPAGRYAFHVIACNNDGLWNETGATLRFIITPAWYQTTSFLILSVAVGFLTLWAAYRMRVRQVATALGVRFDERLAERTRIARDLHDNFLQTIQGSKFLADDALESSTDPARMRKDMEQLSVWLGRATEEGRAALNSLRTSATERNDLAAAFRRATDECRIQTSMEISFSVTGEAEEMHPIVRDEVYRIGYEAIRNACVHSQASHLHVRLTYSNDLKLHIDDDGRGIHARVLEQGKDGHFGIQGMKERAARIMAELTCRSSPGSGTQVALIVPGSIIYSKASASESMRTRFKSLATKLGFTSNSAGS